VSVGRVRIVKPDTNTTKRQQWSEYSTVKQVAIAMVGTVQIALTVLALVDLARRPASRLRGTKSMWLPTLFVQPFGPVAYLIVGRDD
jgi:hypothetical protein